MLMNGSCCLLSNLDSSCSLFPIPHTFPVGKLRHGIRDGEETKAVSELQASCGLLVVLPLPVPSASSYFTVLGPGLSSEVRQSVSSVS